ncbi:MAG: chorismate mutase [Coriobacteriales bacterium]|jgi:chorismate mutase|nr:chorismate mutase [Coriobacteriales bacterium]
MSESDALQAIEEHREAIDALDRQIVELLNARAAKSLEIRALKPEARLGLFDPRREEEIFEKITAHNPGPLYGDDLLAIYQAILRVSKEMH